MTFVVNHQVQGLEANPQNIQYQIFNKNQTLVSVEQESVYQTAATVRLNKKLQNSSEDRKNIYMDQKNAFTATDPIVEAVRLLEHSAALL